MMATPGHNPAPPQLPAHFGFAPQVSCGFGVSSGISSALILGRRCVKTTGSSRNTPLEVFDTFFRRIAYLVPSAPYTDFMKAPKFILTHAAVLAVGVSLALVAQRSESGSSSDGEAAGSASSSRSAAAGEDSSVVALRERRETTSRTRCQSASTADIPIKSSPSHLLPRR
jgi:hypothetical protein